MKAMLPAGWSERGSHVRPLSVEGGQGLPGTAQVEELQETQGHLACWQEAELISHSAASQQGTQGT